MIISYDSVVKERYQKAWLQGSSVLAADLKNTRRSKKSGLRRQAKCNKVGSNPILNAKFCMVCDLVLPC